MKARQFAIFFIGILVCLNAGILPRRISAAGEILPVVLPNKYLEVYFHRSVSTPEEIEKLLDVPFVDDAGWPMIIRVKVNGREQKAAIRTCNDAINNYEIWQPPPGVTKQMGSVFQGNYQTCSMMKGISRLRPAKRTFLSMSIFPLQEKLQKIRLPQSLWQGIGRNILREFKSFRKVDCAPGEVRCFFYTDKYMFAIDTWALGDYNGDGIQDLVISVGIFDFYGVDMVVTQKTQDGGLIVLDGW